MKPTDRPTKNDNGTANSTKDADSEGVGNEQALSQSSKRSPIAATNHENPLPLIIDAGLPPEARNHGDTDGNVPPVYHSSGDGLEVIGNTNEIVDSK